MSLTNWKRPTITRSSRDPYNYLSTLQRDLNDLFEGGFWNEYEGRFPTELKKGFVPAIEVTESKDQYKVKIEMPGVDEKDIHLSIQDNSLIIEGEKKYEKEEKDKEGILRSEWSYGSFYRSVPFKEEVSEEKVKATLNKGVLMVELEKIINKTPKSKRITIQS